MTEPPDTIRDERDVARDTSDQRERHAHPTYPGHRQRPDSLSIGASLLALISPHLAALGLAICLSLIVMFATATARDRRWASDRDAFAKPSAPSAGNHKQTDKTTQATTDRSE